MNFSHVLYFFKNDIEYWLRTKIRKMICNPNRTGGGARLRGGHVVLLFLPRYLARQCDTKRVEERERDGSLNND